MLFTDVRTDDRIAKYGIALPYMSLHFVVLHLIAVKDEKRKRKAYLAALAGVDAIVEAGRLVPANSAQHAVVPVKF